MSEAELSLPPHLDDCIQGQLHLYILRPVLFPSLSSNQSLEFKFSWWGSNHLHNVKLSPDADEIKIKFNICCDFKSLQRYFQDASELEINVFVAEEQSDDQPLTPSSATTKTVAKVSHTKYQLRNKKDWKGGDYVGKVMISNLKFNARGEYVTENDIYNMYRDCSGSVVIFMLYTSQKADNQFSTPTENNCLLVSKNETELPLKPKLPDPNDPEIVININQRNSLSPHEKKSPEMQNSRSRLTRDCLSPRFIPFEKEKKSPRKLATEHCKVKTSPKKKNILKDVNQKVIHDTHNISNLSFASSLALPNFQPKISFDQNFILTRLFSFVDSGAICASDLPSLIQICQGRSPSIEFDSSMFQEENIFINKGKLTENSIGESKPTTKLVTSSKKESISILSKGKKTIDFSGVSYHSDSLPAQPLNVNRIFDDEFFTSLSKEREMKCLEKEDLKRNILNNSNPLTDDDKYLGKKNEDSSVLILKFHSIQFEREVAMEAERNLKALTERQIKGKPVRQRSKLCFFVEVFLEYEGMEEPYQSSLYISRQVENKGVIFGTSQILSLLKQTESRSREGCLKFKISQRRLGNRLREDVGVGIVSLQRLEIATEEEVDVILPLWVPNSQTKKPKARLHNLNLEMPLGKLHFSVAFAAVASDGGVEPLGSSSEEFPFKRIPKLFEAVNDYQAVVLPPNASQRLNPPIGTDVYGEIEVPFPDSKALGSNNESFIIENGSSMNFIPFRGTERSTKDLRQQVHLEILEGNSLPFLRSKRTRESFAPSSYIQTTVSSDSYRTRVVRCTSSPKWNFTTEFKLSPEDLQHTNSHLVLKVFHCLEGTSPEPGDPLLGFATINTQFLWDSFLSLCGWIPVLNLEGEICGEIKVSLTPQRSRWSYNFSPHEVPSLHASQEKGSLAINHELQRTPIRCLNSPRSSILKYRNIPVGSLSQNVSSSTLITTEKDLRSTVQANDSPLTLRQPESPKGKRTAKVSFAPSPERLSADEESWIEEVLDASCINVFGRVEELEESREGEAISTNEIVLKKDSRDIDECNLNTEPHSHHLLDTQTQNALVSNAQAQFNLTNTQRHSNHLYDNQFHQYCVPKGHPQLSLSNSQPHRFYDDQQSCEPISLSQINISDTPSPNSRVSNTDPEFISTNTQPQSCRLYNKQPEHYHAPVTSPQHPHPENASAKPLDTKSLLEQTSRSQKPAETHHPNVAIEGLQWMNNRSLFDTPCVSYIDLGSGDRALQEVANDLNQPVSSSLQKRNFKPKRCRIAANLKFLHMEEKD